MYPHTGPHIVFCDGRKLLDNVTDEYLFWEGEGEPKDTHFVFRLKLKDSSGMSEYLLSSSVVLVGL